MAESAANPLLAFSDHLAQLIERVAGSVVAVAGGRVPASGVHWRSGVIVTAEEALERDEEIRVTLPDGRKVAATLAGRDPSTDVAALRFQPDGLPTAPVADAASLRAGHLVLALGRAEGGPLTSLGIVGLAGGQWHSLRGGTIDTLLRLDLTLARAGEGGALVDAAGRVLGMTVLGPRRRALAIPSATIDRAVNQLLAKGHVARGYLGASLRPVRLGQRRDGGPPAEAERGILVVGLDPGGPAAQAGLLVGDVVTRWNGQPTARVREVMRLLSPESVGQTVDLELLRGGAPARLAVTLGERPLA